MTEADINSLWKDMATDDLLDVNLDAFDSFCDTLGRSFGHNDELGDDQFVGFCPIDDLSNKFLGIEPLIDECDLNGGCTASEGEKGNESQKENDEGLDLLRCDESLADTTKPDEISMKKKFESDAKRDKFLEGIRLNSWYRLTRIEKDTEVKYYNARTGVVKTIASSASRSKTTPAVSQPEVKVENKRGNSLKKVNQNELNRAALEKRKRIRKKNAARIEYLKGISPGRNLCSIPYGNAISYFECISPKLTDILSLPKNTNTCLFRKKASTDIQAMKLF